MLENERAALQKRVAHAIMLTILIITFIAFIFPFFMVVINVFKTKGDINSEPLALIGKHGFTFKNFPEAMKNFSLSPVSANTQRARLLPSACRSPFPPWTETYCGYSPDCTTITRT